MMIVRIVYLWLAQRYVPILQNETKKYIKDLSNKHYNTNKLLHYVTLIA